jgi:hypothetical protein
MWQIRELDLDHMLILIMVTLTSNGILHSTSHLSTLEALACNEYRVLALDIGAISMTMVIESKGRKKHKLE